MDNLLERFIKYTKINTTSVEDTGMVPSFHGERVLAEVLAQELTDMGLPHVEITDDCFVFATIPASKGYEKVETIGLLAHLDTAPDCLGENVKPQIHKNYRGGIIKLNDGVVIDPKQYQELNQYIGHDIVTSDGTTLLGADDKAGIAIIMSTVEQLMRNDSKKHGTIRIAFTPDEEISASGAQFFDVEKFGADFGITVDGDGIGEFNYETFNAYAFSVKIEGNNIHTAEAKGKMVNACSLAVEFDSLLDKQQRPEYTEGREGFIHLYEMSGTVEIAKMEYLIRDFDKEELENKKNFFIEAADRLNEKYGNNRVVLVGTAEYSNPKEIVLSHKNLVNKCEEAFSLCGIEAIIRPIRGGTDGSTLTEKGLPCVNMFLGGHNYHSCREYISVDAMKKSTEILLKMIELFAG